MIRLITGPCVGALVGALETGTVFTIQTVIDVREGAYAGPNNEMIYLGAIYGIIFGGFFGGVIGLIVALRNAHGRDGLLLGSAIGLAFVILLFIRESPLSDLGTILVLGVLPAGASIGLLSGVLTGRSVNNRNHRPKPNKSRRIFS